MAGGSRSAAPTLRYGPAGDSAPLGCGSRRLVWPKGSLSARPRPDQGSAPGLYGSEVEIEGRQLHDPEGGIL